MDIDSMTLGELKAIAAMFTSQGKPSLPKQMIGEYVIVRCKDAGVHSGYLDGYEGREVILSKSRRLWQWWADRGHSLSGVATHGVNASKSKIAAVVQKIVLTESCEIISCTAQGKKSLEGADEYTPE